MTMKFAWTLFVFSVAACILFSLGRYAGRSETAEPQKKKRKRSPDLKADLLQFNFDNDVSKDEDCEIIDAEYENVVVDLQKYRDKREIEKDESCDNYEVMRPSKVDRSAKTSRDVTRLIKKYQDSKDLL